MQSCFEKFLEWRNLTKEEVCVSCLGSGVKTYGNTTTWKGGIGGQALTNDICNDCWGTGSKINKGVNLKELDVNTNTKK